MGLVIKCTRIIELPGKLYYNYSSDCNSLCSCPPYAPKACASFTDVGQNACFVGCCTMPNQTTMFHMVMGEVGNLKYF